MRDAKATVRRRWNRYGKRNRRVGRESLDVSPLWGLSNDDIKTIGAGATTAGVLLALFASPVRRWWRSPMLSLEYDAKRNAPHWDRINVKDEAFFLRLRVRNARGCDAADDVQVLVAAYHAGNLGLEGRALEWSGQRERGGTPVTTLRVPPGLQRHVDLLQITPSPSLGAQTDEELVSPSYDDQPTVDARLCVHPKPWGAGHRVPVAGDHDVVLIVTAANADSISYRMTISHEGALSADLLGKPKRVHRRGPLAKLKAVLKLVLAGFRSSKV